jgi:hypothetical protein
VTTVAHSFLAAADLAVDSGSVWVDLKDVLELPSTPLNDVPRRLTEVELPSESEDGRPTSKTDVSKEKRRSEHQTVLPEFKIAASRVEKIPQVVAVPSDDVTVQLRTSDYWEDTATGKTRIRFPADVPQSEIVRVGRTFNGMVQESLREADGLFARRYVGTLAQSEGAIGEKLADLETTLIDEISDIEDSYALSPEVENEIETNGLDPFKTYTVVGGQIRAIVPKKVQRDAGEDSPAVQPSVRITQPENRPAQFVVARSGAAPKVFSEQNLPETLRSSAIENKVFQLSKEEVSQQLSQISPPAQVASVDSNPSQSSRVTVRGRVTLPEGFSADRTVLRMAGTSFQVQTDASGVFELRDVPRDTRFEMLVWHLDGSLTRRLVPVVASERERNVEIALVKTSDVDSLATAFGLVQQMNRGGFCARVENGNVDSLNGGQISVTSGRTNLQAHFFSSNGLPMPSQLELSADGRFCVFNTEDAIVDVKVKLLNGVRRSFVVHVEPSTFEHDLVFDTSESMYRKASVLELLDSQKVIESSAQNVQPEFGDKRMRDWIFGNDVPVWTAVTRFLMQTDSSYATIRPALDDVQYFPGGQELIEVRFSADQDGAPWSRVLMSRDQLMTNSMLKNVEGVAGKVYQDRNQPLSIPVLDSDAWNDIVAEYDNVEHLTADSVGGVYISVDTFFLRQSAENIVISVRDTWYGKDVCKVVPLKNPKTFKKGRYLRAVCSAPAGQYALIVEGTDGELLWSDVARVRQGDVQTLTVQDQNF